MIDTGKVISGLESLRDICNAKSNMAIGNGKVAWAGYANTADDALALLKEQEPIQMKVFEDYGSIKFGYCPKCKSLINNRSYPKSCGCGQAVKWE